MNWKFNPDTNTYTYTEFEGTYGYCIIPYTNKYTEGKNGYILYFHNAWRTDRPLGEYITIDGNLSHNFTEPSGGFHLNDIVFDSIEQTMLAAEKHKAKEDEPTSYENEDSTNI